MTDSKKTTGRRNLLKGAAVAAGVQLDGHVLADGDRCDVVLDGDGRGAGAHVAVHVGDSQHFRVGTHLAEVPVCPTQTIPSGFSVRRMSRALASLSR